MTGTSSSVEWNYSARRLMVGNNLSNHGRVYVVILTWNQWAATASCLRSVSQIVYPDYQVVVVDNGSKDNTVVALREHFPAVEVIATGRNLGFAAGCNVGIQYALSQGADYILLLNNDTLVESELLDVLVAEAEALSDAGILSPRLRYMDDPEKIWFVGSRRHWLTLDPVDFGPLGPRRHVGQDERHTVDYIFGTAMFIPKKVFADVGFLDEDFFLYYEDMDFSLRVQRAGYKLYYVPQVSVQHGISVSTESLSSMRYYHKAKGSVVFYRKHAGPIRRLVLIPIRVGSMIRTIIRLASWKQLEAAQAYVRGLRDGLTMQLGRVGQPAESNSWPHQNLA